LSPNLIQNSEKEIAIKSKTENLSIVRDFIYDCCNDRQIAGKTVDDVVLAVDEACTNVIKHAYKYLPDRKIIVKVIFRDNKFLVDITDFGNSFESDTLKRPDMNEYFKMKKVGGLGVHLMKTLMDDVRYESIPGKYNKVILTKAIA